MLIADAAIEAGRLARFALDGLPADDRHFHPGVLSHLTAARVQLDAAIRLLDPSNDQIVV